MMLSRRGVTGGCDMHATASTCGRERQAGPAGHIALGASSRLYVPIGDTRGGWTF